MFEKFDENYCEFDLFDSTSTIGMSQKLNLIKIRSIRKVKSNLREIQ